MEGELLSFIRESGLSPFSSSPAGVSSSSVFKTRDAKSVHNRLLTRLSSHFSFSSTKYLFDFFSFTGDEKLIARRQEFFRSLDASLRPWLKSLSVPRRTWKPKYDVVVVTEDESSFVRLRDLGCTVQLLVSESDVLDLERYDVVQVLDCSTFRLLLERLPQSVFIDSFDNVYLERHLELLSSWSSNLELLSSSPCSSRVKSVVDRLLPLLDLTRDRSRELLSVARAEEVLDAINDSVSSKIRDLTISGDALLKMLGESKMPPVILSTIQSAIENSGLPEHVFNIQVPVSLDYQELDDQIRRQSSQEFTNLAAEVKRHAVELKSIPELLELLSSLLLLEDFSSGLAFLLNGDNVSFPSLSSNLHLRDAKNLFLDAPQPISFQLDSFSSCSILTGANSGGKTTLLEHVLQLVSLFQLGLPVFGSVHMPLFSEVYYFAKNKGSASKGAFETLLSQMSKVAPGPKTLILADEIEAVTEPGVAGRIIASTASFFIAKGCFLIVATHLGHEVRDVLPDKARIDGIEAKGLDEQFNLIVDHNPVLGRLAHSTPELIVERLASSSPNEYFLFLHDSLKKTGMSKDSFSQ